MNYKVAELCVVTYEYCNDFRLLLRYKSSYLPKFCLKSVVGIFFHIISVSTTIDNVTTTTDL